MNSSMMSGVGVERDVALRGAFSQNQRTYTTVVRRESRRIPLGLGPTVKHWDILNGDVISVENGRVVPLRSDLGFGGIVEGVGFGGTQYVVEVLVRGSVHARITDAAGCTLKEGLPVYVRVEGRRQTFGVTAEGGVLAGEILFVEEQLKGTVIEVAPLGWTVSVRS